MREYAREHRIEIIEITPELKLPEVVQERLGRGQRLFIAGGGDGTIHHVLQHLVHTDGVLGILPLGTFNHFARDLGIPLEWRAAFDLALSDSIQQIDAGRVNDRWFVNSMMLGIYPAIATYRERFRRTDGKWKAYWKSTRLAARHFSHVSITLEAPHRMEVIKTQLFAVSVNAYDLSRIGLMAPKMSFDQGRLTAYWLPYMDKLRLINSIAKYLRGRVSEVAGFRWMHTVSLKVHSGRPLLRIGTDGELYDMKPPLHVTVHPSSLLVKRPRSD